MKGIFRTGLHHCLRAVLLLWILPGTAIGQRVNIKPFNGTTKVNYVRTWEATNATQSPDTLKAWPVQQSKQVTQYFDGLGRPLQTVVKQISPTGNDMVTAVQYDAFGREQYKYIPFSAINAGTWDITNSGNIKTDPFQEDSVFSKNQYPGETYYYGQDNFEASPLDRPLVSYAPGNSWVGGSRGITQQYLFNTASDSVRIWNILSAAGSTPTSPGIYSSGQLFKNLTIDESNHQTIEYTDKNNHVVLKRIQAAASPGTAHVGWLNTYYVYDSLENLRFVIPPLAVESIISSWSFSSSVNFELCFRYEYDQRNRMVIKKVPGAGEVWMVYDARDRLIMTQDSLLRGTSPAKWFVTKYDSLNRKDTTGLLTDANSRAYHQNLAYNSVSYPGTVSNFEILTSTYYDDYSWVSGSGSGLGSDIDSSSFSNASYFLTGYYGAPYYPVRMSRSLHTRGMTTGSKVKVVASASTYLYSVSFFDDHGRVIQSQNTNNSTGKDTVSTQYDFSGQVLRSFLKHNKSGTNAQRHTILTKMEYDFASRLKRIWKNIDNAGTDQLIDSMYYNELGQLQRKYLGKNVDSLTYDYNIRGWLTGINKNYLISGTANYFGMELGYDKTASVTGTTSYAAAQFNGNITGTVWKSRGDGIDRKYDFVYDIPGRLQKAVFTQNSSGSTWDNSAMDFSVNGFDADNNYGLKYDANGNIQGMVEHGFKIGDPTGYIDALRYTYSSNSNKLKIVSDDYSDPNTKLGDFHDGTNAPGTDDYAYDGNGNLTLDNNKAISAIAYNYLSLPQQITITGKGTITYTYDATGNKLAKTTVDNTTTPSKTTTTSYFGSFVYQNDTLQFIGHEEGRARWAFHKYLAGSTAYGFEYDFFEKDHLGNTRVVLTQQKDTTQYIATMEAAYRTTENALFYNIPVSSYSRASVPGPYPADGTTNPNDSVARVNGSGQKIGPYIILKVMAGDVVDIAAKSYYLNQSDTATSSYFTDVLNSLANGIVNMTAGAKGTVGQLTTTNGSLYNALNSFISAHDPTPSGKPKAYLNWMLVDEQFNYVSSYPQSGAIPVGNYTAGTLGTPGYTGIPITKGGYLYIYVSNETQNWNVFFDNLSVKQYSGPMLEETHYYPFGLTMAGISSKALKPYYAENKYKFNSGSELQNKEFSDGSGWEMYDASFRMYDPQIGRFGQIDPIAPFMEDWSPYVFCFDNPISYTDETGLDPENVKPKSKHKRKHKTQTLPTVVVVGYKKNCKTCGHPTVDVNVHSGFKPPSLIIDDVNSGVKDLKDDAFRKYELLKRATERGSVASDWLDQISKVAGNEKAAKIFARVGTGLNVVSVAFDLNDQDYLNATIDAVGFVEKANPYILTYQTGKMIFNSNFLLSGAANDAQVMINNLLMQAKNANDHGNTKAAEDYIQQAVQYERIRNANISDLESKK